jgi:hypothetical protein
VISKPSKRTVPACRCRRQPTRHPAASSRALIVSACRYAPTWHLFPSSDRYELRTGANRSKNAPNSRSQTLPSEVKACPVKGIFAHRPFRRQGKRVAAAASVFGRGGPWRASQAFPGGSWAGRRRVLVFLPPECSFCRHCHQCRRGFTDTGGHDRLRDDQPSVRLGDQGADLQARRLDLYGKSQLRLCDRLY